MVEADFLTLTEEFKEQRLIWFQIPDSTAGHCSPTVL